LEELENPVEFHADDEVDEEMDAEPAGRALAPLPSPLQQRK